MLHLLSPSNRETAYNDYDVMFLLEKLAEAAGRGKMIGRGGLSGTLGIGEGLVRSMLQRLKATGFVNVTRAGVTLGENGRSFLDAVKVSVMELEHTDSAIGTHQVSLLVRGRAHLIGKGVEQRDSGLKAGGDGCTTIVCREGRLVLPPEWSIDDNSPSLAAQIHGYGVTDGDVVLIGGSNTGVREAAAAANSAALALLDQNR